MNQRLLKYIFFFLATLILAALLITSKDAGISGDEEVHYKQSEMVYQYFATLGKDQSSLNTPVTHLKYYGQAYDNVVTILIHWFSIEDVYSFRHFMSSIAGWLAIFITGLLAVSLGGYSAGVLTLLLFAVSPTFLGHAHNNLKDVPFALAYIAAIYFMVRLFFQQNKIPKITITLLVLSIALAIGIRPGGLLILAYLWFFVSLEMAYRQWEIHKIEWRAVRKRFLLLTGISFTGYFLGLILWPYALQNPISNPWESYRIMTHFPTTIRQIFEGNFIWSDLLPWYYLPKSMLITVPVVVWIGVVLFICLGWKLFKRTPVLYLFLLFALFFPPVFAIIKQSNLYGSWRHFLFIYPLLVVLAALGFNYMLSLFKSKVIYAATALIILLLAFHPFRFMVVNHPYYYLYYNQIAGGLEKAYGSYETDYYYHSVREATEWLVQYLEKNNIQSAVIGSNFMISWHLRNHKGYKPVFFSWDKRSSADWDYAIIANSYIPPFQLQNKIWPPQSTIHSIMVDGVPVCAVLKRGTKNDAEGIKALKAGNPEIAIEKLHEAAKADSANETIYYFLGQAHGKLAQKVASDSAYKLSLEWHPNYEVSLFELGKNSEVNGDKKTAALYYDHLIEANPRFLKAFILRAKLYSDAERDKARELLKYCLKINPRYVAAINALADSYRETDPEIAKKYYKLAKSIK